MTTTTLAVMTIMITTAPHYKKLDRSKITQSTA
jgi:hypothetical protein